MVELICYGAAAILVIGYALYTITRPNRRDWIPFLGQTWFLDEQERARYRSRQSLEHRIAMIVRGQERACRQSGIKEVVPRTRSDTGESYERGVRLGPFFASADGAVVYSLIQEPLPAGHSIAEMRTETFETNAHQNCKYTTVLYHAKKEDNFDVHGRTGFYFLRTSMDARETGIPTVVRYEDALEALRKHKGKGSKPLAWVVGMAEGGRYTVGDIAGAVPHLLVAGSTGGGKTIDLINVILTLCLENPPSDIALVLCDLKRNTFSLYFEHLPHLACPIVTTLEDAMNAISALRAERARRADLFNTHGRRTWQEWNANVPPGQLPLRLFVCVIDEIHMLIIRNEGKREFLEAMWEISSMGREMGIFLVLATQTVKANILTSEIKTNIEARIAHFTDGPGSQTILDNWDAKDLPDLPGRIVYKIAAHRAILQAPVMASSWHGWDTLPSEQKLVRISTAIHSYVSQINTKWTEGDLHKKVFLTWVSTQTYDAANSAYPVPSREVAAALAHVAPFRGMADVKKRVRSWGGSEFILGGEIYVLLTPRQPFPWILKKQETRNSDSPDLAPATVDVLPLALPERTDHRGECRYCAFYGDRGGDCPLDSDWCVDGQYLCWTSREVKQCE